jgi:hypothetical protein
MTATWKMPYLAALLLAWSDYHLEDAAQLNEKFIFIQNGASFFLKLLKKPCICLLKNRCNNLKSKPFEFNCVSPPAVGRSAYAV